MDSIKTHFEEARALLDDFLASGGVAKVGEVISLMSASLKGGGKIMTCGNGGSMSDAMHFAEELTGRFRENRKPMAAMAISDPGHLSCVANDYGYEEVFARAVEALGKPGDVLLAISTSGQSPNICKAAEQARSMGMKVVALTGKDAGKLAGL